MQGRNVFSSLMCGDILQALLYPPIAEVCFLVARFISSPLLRKYLTTKHKYGFNNLLSSLSLYLHKITARHKHQGLSINCSFSFTDSGQIEESWKLFFGDRSVCLYLQEDEEVQHHNLILPSISSFSQIECSFEPFSQVREPFVTISI